LLLRHSSHTPHVVAKNSHGMVRTVERRLELLRKAAVYYVRPNSHYARVPGVSFGLLCFEYSKAVRGTALPRILRVVTNQVGRQVEAQTRGMLVIHGSARELEDSTKAVASVPDVHDVFVRCHVGVGDTSGY